MTVRASLLLQVDPGRSDEVRNHLAALPCVVGAATTSGAYDAVIEVAAPDEAGLQRVLQAARSAPGLARLCICRAGRPSDAVGRPDWMPWATARAANA